MRNHFARAIKWIVEPILLKIFCFDFAARVIDYLSYQRKRQLMREIESRLRASGQYPDSIIRGPFEGLIYPSGRLHARYAKIIGSYEREIHKWFFDFFQNGGFTSHLNIGAADGYYSIALANQFPDIPGYAFEADTNLHAIAKEFAQLNHVESNLKISGRCDFAVLAALDPGSKPLVICDVDGGEAELLDIESVAWLKDAIILVETHDCFRKGVTDQLKSDFSRSHTIEEVHTSGRNPHEFPELTNLKMKEISAVIDEERPSVQSWLLLTPRGMKSS